MIVHWPKGLKTKPGSLTTQTGYITDFMPTLVELCGAKYPAERNGVPIPPTEGESLAATFQGKAAKQRTLCVEHEGNRMVREGDWKLVAHTGNPWELYDLAKDPAEMANLAIREPGRVQKMSADWQAWAVRCNVIARPNPGAQRTPEIANRPLTIRCDVSPSAGGSSGVILAQGGNQRGYALHMKSGVPVFNVREGGSLYTVTAPAAPKGKFALEARLAKNGAMTLAIDGKVVATGKASGLITAQPKDGLSIGEDTLSPVGDYAAPNAFRGKVENVRVDTGDKPS